jgi:hypothetical protein
MRAALLALALSGCAYYPQMARVNISPGGAVPQGSKHVTGSDCSAFSHPNMGAAYAEALRKAGPGFSTLANAEIKFANKVFFSCYEVEGDAAP